MPNSTVMHTKVAAATHHAKAGSRPINTRIVPTIPRDSKGHTSVLLCPGMRIPEQTIAP